MIEMGWVGRKIYNYIFIHTSYFLLENNEVDIVQFTMILTKLEEIQRKERESKIEVNKEIKELKWELRKREVK